MRRGVWGWGSPSFEQSLARRAWALRPTAAKLFLLVVARSKRFEDVAADAVGVLKTSVHHAAHRVTSGVGEVVGGEVLSYRVVELVKVALVASLAVLLISRIIETVSDTLAHLLAEHVLFEKVAKSSLALVLSNFDHRPNARTHRRTP